MGLHESREELVPQIWLLLWMEGEHGAGGRAEGSEGIRSKSQKFTS